MRESYMGAGEKQQNEGGEEGHGDGRERRDGLREVRMGRGWEGSFGTAFVCAGLLVCARLERRWRSIHDWNDAMLLAAGKIGRRFWVRRERICASFHHDLEKARNSRRRSRMIKVGIEDKESILFQRHAALLVTNNALCLMSGLVSGI